jgi:hypothetical protein
LSGHIRKAITRFVASNGCLERIAERKHPAAKSLKDPQHAHQDFKITMSMMTTQLVVMRAVRSPATRLI